jgi:hypothetical protein
MKTKRRDFLKHSAALAGVGENNILIWDRIGLDLLEEKRLAQGLESIRAISTHVAACARKGLGTDDLAKIDMRVLSF